MMHKLVCSIVNKYGTKPLKFLTPLMILSGVITVFGLISPYIIPSMPPFNIATYVGALMFIFAFGVHSELGNSFTDFLMVPEIQKYYPDSLFIDFTKVANIDTQIFYNTNMVRVSDKVFINNLLKTDKFTHMQFASAPYDGHKVFNGTLLELKEDTGVNGYVRILSTEIVEADEVTFVDKECVLTPVKIETGDDAFDNSYDVYADSEESASMILTPYVKEMLNTFLEKYGYFAICFMPNSILVSFLKPRVFFKNSEKADFSDVPKIVENAANGIDELVASLESIINSISIYQ